MAEVERKHVDLGFAEKPHFSWHLLSHFFPSKLGGAPAWLSLNNLPQDGDLICRGCSKTTRFLMQLYCPLENNVSTFHRTLFVFICSEPSCKARDFKAFRSQLCKQNLFYSENPPDMNKFDSTVAYPKASSHQKMCSVCNCVGSKACSKCQKENYCCKDHQAFAWKKGHKLHCGNVCAEDVDYTKVYCFEEYEIVIESEELDSGTGIKTEEERLKDYQEFLRCEKTNKHEGVNEKCWDSVQSGEVKDAAYLKLGEIISHNPNQVVRYQRGGKPLLVSDESSPPSAPACEHCGQPRIFELQIMSQTLNYLHIDSTDESVDWGTLIVYTCSESCHTDRYAKEYIWKQDFSYKNVVDLH